LSLFDADPGAQSPASGEAGESPQRPKLKLVVAYEGTDFHGFAAQPDVRTVAGTLAPALEKVLRHEPDLTCAGRTDAGVHAWGQVVSLPCEPETDPRRIQKALNGMLAPEVVVRSCELVDPSFDARFSARWRAYRYTIVNRPVPDPFLARYAWWVPGALELPAMQLGADPFVGEHDFAAFCRGGPPGSTTVRRVEECRWREGGDGVLWLEIRATAFCWQMVRSIVGTLVDIGTGARRAGEVMGMLRARDRAVAGRVAPPQGLCLREVGY
jgi:tRNA pseudouridine38-40 synthase